MLKIWVNMLFFASFSLGLPISAYAQNQCSSLIKNRESFELVNLVLNLKREFVGEENGVLISTASGIFGQTPVVRQLLVKTRYLTDSEIAETRAYIERGKLVTNFPESIEFIFVVTIEGELRVYPITSEGSRFLGIKHSSLVQGQPVLMAGEIALNSDHTFFSVNNRSGHYSPGLQNLKWFVSLIKERGAKNFKSFDVRTGTFLIDPL